jgi:hypothetical protein
MPDTGSNLDSAEESHGPDDRLRQAEAASGIGTFDMDLENGHWTWGPPRCSAQIPATAMIRLRDGKD